MDLEVGSIALVTAVGTYANQTIMFTQTYAAVAAVPDTDANVAALALLTALRAGGGGGDILETAYLGCLTENYTLTRWTVQIVQPVRGVIQSVNRGLPGLIEEDPHTANVAAAITLRTELAGRRYVANKHIGPAPTSATYLDGGVFKVAYTDKLVSLKNALLIGFNNILSGYWWKPCITHRAPLTGYSLVTSGVAQSSVRVQRRRTVGLGI